MNKDEKAVSTNVGSDFGAILTSPVSRLSGHLMEPVLSRGVVINEWIGAWIADYEDASCRPTLQLLEKMLREHHGYPRPYDPLRR
ncbi:MAG: hypothetical protein MZV63_63245 [Marinilabiliales bacterium]|nr:hypothetical protein [Marinilabiliales bacterium]